MQDLLLLLHHLHFNVQIISLSPSCLSLSLWVSVSCSSMSSECSGYSSSAGVSVDGFFCPRPGNAAAAVYCCGFNDVKYCCDDPNSFFPYEYGYMWWLRYFLLLIGVFSSLCHLFETLKYSYPYNKIVGCCKDVVWWSTDDFFVSILFWTLTHMSHEFPLDSAWHKIFEKANY